MRRKALAPTSDVAANPGLGHLRASRWLGFLASEHHGRVDGVSGALDRAGSDTPPDSRSGGTSRETLGTSATIAESEMKGR